MTGASSGIGAGIARALAAAGVRVALVARRAERLDALAAEIGAAGGSAESRPCDVTDEAAVEALFAGVASRFGRIDILVNNAGIADHTPTEALSLDRWRQVLDANLTSAFLCARAAFRHMKTQGGGRMLHIGSLSAQVPRPDTIAYSASKFALRGLNHSLAVDGRAHGIASSLYHPGMVATELVPGMADRDPATFMTAEDTARIVLLMLDMPPHVAFTESTALPLTVPFLGRG
ncbi:MAG: SDR family oxidoreductase [Sphingomonas fennica]